MEIKSENQTINIEGREVHFEYPIKDFKVIGNYCVVLLKIPSKFKYNENVFGIDKDGIIWQIEEKVYNHDNSPFVSIFTEGDKIRLQNWDGTQLIVEPSSGKILDQKWHK